jgi:ParB family chromosome partitioning protein
MTAKKTSRATREQPPASLKVEKALSGCERMGNLLRIKLNRVAIDASQPRTEFDEDELKLLAESLRSQGQLQPCVVRYDGERDKYVLLVGERRFRAARLAGLEELVCIVDLTKRDATERLITQVIENEQRSSLTPIERAKAYKLLMEKNGWNVKQLAHEVNQHPGTVSRVLALLKLSREQQARVNSGELSAKKARASMKAGPNSTGGEAVTIRTEQGVVTVKAYANSSPVDVLAAALKKALPARQGPEKKAA